MPVSIPTYLAVRFVTNSSLKQRINVLEKSYKLQIAGLSVFSAANVDKLLIVKKIPQLALLIT